MAKNLKQELVKPRRKSVQLQPAWVYKRVQLVVAVVVRVKKIGTTRKCTSVVQKCLIKETNEWNVQRERKFAFLRVHNEVSRGKKKRSERKREKKGRGEGERAKGSSWKMLYHDNVLRPNGKRISRQCLANSKLCFFMLLYLYEITRNTR